jgi:hypothetical protein
MREVMEDETLRGSYDDVAGLYVCVGADCTISLTEDGTVQVAGTGASLLFRADDPEVLLPDSDYLAFGVWTEIPDNPTQANPGRVRPFAYGSTDPYTASDIMELEEIPEVVADPNADPPIVGVAAIPDGRMATTGAGPLQGSASYSGPSVGHWATRAKGAHMVDEGRFTATAELEADFDGPGMGLSGTVDAFMMEDGTAMSGWLVKLNDGTMAIRNNPKGDINGGTTGSTGSLDWTGVWEAWLFGDNKGNHPTGVAGNFQASSGTAQPVQTPEARIDLFSDEGFAGVAGSFAGR